MKKTIRWTVDYPSLYWELLDSNLPALGSAITAFCYLLMNFENLYRIAERQNNTEILSELKFCGIDADYFKKKKVRYSVRGSER